MSELKDSTHNWDALRCRLHGEYLENVQGGGKNINDQELPLLVSISSAIACHGPVVRQGNLVWLYLHDVLYKDLIVSPDFLFWFSTHGPGDVIPAIRSVLVIGSQGLLKLLVLLCSPGLRRAARRCHGTGCHCRLKRVGDLVTSIYRWNSPREYSKRQRQEMGLLWDETKKGAREKDLEVKRGCYGEASSILAPYKLEAKLKGGGLQQVGE